jgi:feruloyl-CoA synthase
VKVLWFAGAAIAQHVFDEVKALGAPDHGRGHPVPHRAWARPRRALYHGAHVETHDATNMGCAAGRRDQARADGRKYEARIKGPHITPGYWRQPELTPRRLTRRVTTASAIPSRWRTATGTRAAVPRAQWRRFQALHRHLGETSGPLRARFIEHFAPLVRDVVIAGEGKSEVGALIFLAGKASPDELRAKLRVVVVQRQLEPHRARHGARGAAVARRR